MQALNPISPNQAVRQESVRVQSIQFQLLIAANLNFFWCASRLSCLDSDLLNGAMMQLPKRFALAANTSAYGSTKRWGVAPLLIAEAWPELLKRGLSV